MNKIVNGVANDYEFEFANTIPTASTYGKMVAELVVQNANMKERIHDLLKENTEWKLENERLNNIINELEEDLPHLLEIIKRNECEIMIYQDEWFAIKSCKYKLKELKENK